MIGRLSRKLALLAAILGGFATLATIGNAMAREYGDAIIFAAIAICGWLACRNHLELARLYDDGEEDRDRDRDRDYL